MARSILSRAFVMLCGLLSTYGALQAQDERDLQSEKQRKDVSVQSSTAVGSANADRRILSVEEMQTLIEKHGGEFRWRPHQIDLAPAKWIWLPSQRTLPNTFVLFRRESELETSPVRASGWITADSRYRSSRVQPLIRRRVASTRYGNRRETCAKRRES